MYQYNPSTEDLIVRLDDGRNIGYAIYGNPNGYPIFYFHGFPGSRFEGKLIDEPLKISPFKLYALDRPGIGNSSPQKNRTLLNWADDVREFADKLKIKRFAVLGISGGGPYAVVCAYKIPANRLVATMVVSGMGPAESNKKNMTPLFRAGLILAKYSRVLFRLIYRPLFYDKFKTIDRAIKTTWKMIDALMPEEQKLYQVPKMKEIFVANQYYGYVQGPEGTAQDVEIYARPWGFNLEDIPKNAPFLLIHGEKDNVIPVEMGRYITSRITHCESNFYPNGTHFTTAEYYLKDLFGKVLILFKKIDSS